MRLQENMKLWKREYETFIMLYEEKHQVVISLIAQFEVIRSMCSQHGICPSNALKRSLQKSSNTCQSAPAVVTHLFKSPYFFISSAHQAEQSKDCKSTHRLSKRAESGRPVSNAKHCQRWSESQLRRPVRLSDVARCPRISMNSVSIIASWTAYQPIRLWWCRRRRGRGEKHTFRSLPVISNALLKFHALVQEYQK